MKHVFKFTFYIYCTKQTHLKTRILYKFNNLMRIKLYCRKIIVIIFYSLIAVLNYYLFPNLKKKLYFYTLVERNFAIKISLNLLKRVKSFCFLSIHVEFQIFPFSSNLMGGVSSHTPYIYMYIYIDRYKHTITLVTFLSKIIKIVFNVKSGHLKVSNLIN